MEIASKFYHEYLGTKVNEIPFPCLVEIIDEFAANAKFYMSSDVDSETTVKINSAAIDLLKNRFAHLPFNLVAEAFTRGSLGEIGGTTRFTVRNIYIWLTAVDEKNQRLSQESQTRLDSEKRATEEKVFKQSQKRSSLYASAFYWKISHCPLLDKDYDRLTLDKIVEAFQKGYTFRELTPSMIL
jgi:hypothetical protein